MNDEEFFQGVKDFVDLGVSIIGGCCGTNETFIKKICDNIDKLQKKEPKRRKSTIVCSAAKYIDIQGPTIVGE